MAIGAYTDETEVRRMLEPHWIYEEDSPVTISDITDWVIRIEALIDGYLRNLNYTPLPVTDKTAVAMLKGFATMKVAAIIWITTHQERPLLPDFVRSWHEDFDQFVKALSEGNLMLPGNVTSNKVRLGSIDLGTIQTADT